MSTYNVESITEIFPNPNVLKVTDNPTWKTIKEVEKHIITNLASIRYEIGGGNHGFLELIVAAAKHLNIIGHTFIPYPNPGALPQFTHNTTQHQIIQGNAT